MNKNYFNVLEFTKALSFINKDPMESAIRFKEYFDKYPKDYSAYPYYASALITLGNFEEASKILNIAYEQVKNDEQFKKDRYKMRFFNHNFLYTKLRILCYLERYQEAHDICLKNRFKTDVLDTDTILYYCKKKLGLLKDNDRESNSYIYRQIHTYMENDFIDHIQKHLSEYNSSEEEPNRSIFAADFPLDKVISEIKNNMPYQNKIFHGFFDDIYTFKYDNCGRDKNKVTDYFKVVCFHNTCDFITMCPTSYCSNYVDLNYLNYCNVKVKRISQIDKFNKKYKR